MSYDKLTIVLEVEAFGEIITRRVLNFMNPAHRQTIAKTAWWAMHQGHTLITRPVDAGEKIKEVYKEV